MFLKCPYTILAVKRKVLLYKTMDLFLFFSLAFIVIEDPTLNDLDLNIISSDKAISTKRDSSHLELPTVAVEESNRSRFQAPPSAFTQF
jgi:hypothetical protein